MIRWNYFIKHRFTEQGQGLIEYSLILVLVAIVVIAILLALGPVVGNVFSNITGNLQRTGVISGSGGNTFSVTGISLGATNSGGGVSSAQWSATCSESGCTVTVQCTFFNGGGVNIGSVTTSTSPCQIGSAAGAWVTIQVTNAALAGYTWDGSAPSTSGW